MPPAATIKMHLQPKPDTAKAQAQCAWNPCLVGTLHYICANLLLPDFGTDANRTEAECSQNASKIEPHMIRT